MASQTVVYDDGNQSSASSYGSQRFAVPVQDGHKIVKYPFKDNQTPDVECIITERNFVVRQSYDVDLINLTTLNGGFETAGGGGADVFANWTESVGTGTLTRDTSNFHSGSACAKWVNGGVLQSASLTQSVLTPGKSYKWSLWAKSETGASLYGFSIYDGSSLVYTASQLTTSWVKYEGSFVASTASFTVNMSGGLSTPAVFVDDVIVTELNSVDSFHENSLAAATKSFTNKFLYSSDIDNAAWTKGSSGGGSSPTITAGFNGPDGVLPAWRVQANTGGTGDSYFYQIITGLSNPYTQALSFWYKSNTGSNQTFFIEYKDSANISKVLTATNKWKQFWITNASSTTNAGIVLGASIPYGTTSSIDVLVAGFQLDNATYIGPWISTTSAEVTKTLRYVDGVTTPKIYGNNTPFLDYDQDSLSWIVEETDPENTGIGNLLRFKRRFARIPANQIIYSSKYIDRPSVDGIKSGTSYGVSFRDGYDHIFTSRKSVTETQTVDEQVTTAAFPATNITLTDSGANVANIAANASAATWAAGLATLTALTRTSAFVSSGAISITWSGTMSSIVVPTGVKLSAYSATFLAQFWPSGSTVIPGLLKIRAPSHGGVVGDKVAFWSGDTLLGRSVVQTVIDADEFSVMLNEIDFNASLATHCAFSSDAAYCVATGPKMCSIRLTQRFYLPGYTTGITTAADITPPATATDPVSWLAAIVASTAWVVDSVTDLKSWEGPILVQEASEVQMSDALDTTTP